LITFEVRELQTGDHNRQENTFIYAISSSPTGTELLSNNSELARALADYICPPHDGEPSVLALQERFTRVLNSLPVDWRDERDRDLTFYPPDVGEVLRIERADGVTIGIGNQQDSSTAVDIPQVAMDIHKVAFSSKADRQRLEQEEKERAQAEAEWA
jgi:hypothetical protein